MLIISSLGLLPGFILSVRVSLTFLYPEFIWLGTAKTSAKQSQRNALWDANRGEEGNGMNMNNTK